MTLRKVVGSEDKPEVKSDDETKDIQQKVASGKSLDDTLKEQSEDDK